jgi:hypothetical protein
VRILALVVMMLAVAGCNMSAPGVARVGPSPGANYQTTYNSDWVNRKSDPLETIEREDMSLGADLSKREFGVSYWGEDPTTGRRIPAHKQRQMERQEARRAAWRERMGITRIGDE